MKFIQFFIFLFLFETVFASDDSFRVEFGILEKVEKLVNKSYFVKEETSSIPYVTKKEGQQFGAVIYPSNKKSYRVKYAITLPGRPDKLNLDSNSSAEGKRINSKEIKYKGPYAIAMGLDKGDPVGRYKLEIFVNGEQIFNENFYIEVK